jgi:hypothetical protein
MKKEVPVWLVISVVAVVLGVIAYVFWYQTTPHPRKPPPRSGPNDLHTQWFQQVPHSTRWLPAHSAALNRKQAGVVQGRPCPTLSPRISTQFGSEFASANCTW